MLTPLDNEVIFKKAFTDKTVFTNFVHDIVGIDFEVNKIETEKKFFPEEGNIDFAYDIFAESKDHRAVIEIQRVEYDYHFDRFLHYHNMAIAEQQQRADAYMVKQVVYTIVILTAPYTMQTKDHRPVRDEVLISSVDPQSLDGKVCNLYGHRLVFLNPNYQDKSTPADIRDWLKLIYASIHQRENYKLNQQKPGIKKAIDIIDYQQLSPVERREMKIAESKKQAMKVMSHELDKEKQRADKTLQKALKALKETGMTSEEAKKAMGLEE